MSESSKFGTTIEMVKAGTEDVFGIIQDVENIEPVNMNCIKATRIMIHKDKLGDVDIFNFEFDVRKVLSELKKTKEKGCHSRMWGVLWEYKNCRIDNPNVLKDTTENFIFGESVIIKHGKKDRGIVDDGVRLLYLERQILDKKLNKAVELLIEKDGCYAVSKAMSEAEFQEVCGSCDASKEKRRECWMEYLGE